MALELVELDTVQLLEAFAAVLTREVVVGLRGVLLHVPVEGCALPTLVPTDLTPTEKGGGQGKNHRDREGEIRGSKRGRGRGRE